MPTKIQQPAPLEPATSEDLAEALKVGDALAVGDVLRRMKGLGAGDCELLADLFVDEPSIREIFPFRPKFVRSRRGKPRDFLKRAAENTSIRWDFERAREEYKSFEAAVADVMKKRKLSRPRILRALAATKRSSH
jgi:hypothetical protein